jgi:hypothetical protein
LNQTKAFQNTSLGLSGTIQDIILIICQTKTYLEKMAAQEWAKVCRFCYSV